MKTENPVRRRILLVAWATTAAVYLLLFLEWLFQVTKPSMFTVISWPQRSAILLAAALVASIPAVGIAVLLASLGSRLAGRWRDRASGLGLLVPAVVLSAAGLLLLENFTKTVFGFNAGSFTSPIRYLYAVGWLLLAFWIRRSLAVWTGAAARRRREPLVAGAMLVGMALLLVASAFAAWLRYEPQRAVDSIRADGGGELPNILILSSDGLDAANMSVYGYGRATTPFLDSRSDEFLLSENHFSNSTLTTASISALLSGKLPTETGVLRAGHAFRGEDVFQHLPGLLRQLGYYNIDISARAFGDAYDMNIRQGFHVANGRSFGTETLPVLRWVGSAYPSESYFLGLTSARLRERFLHAVGFADMVDPFDLVAKKGTPSMRDAERIKMLKAEIARAPRPFFAQVHLYDTHRFPDPERGPDTQRHRSVARPFFSAKAEARWADFYDDMILGYDDFVEEVVAHLEAAGEFERTLLIINTDHDERRLPHARLPLMIRFPNAEHRGRIVANTQRVDIAPTILSYLGIEPPDWMAGQSLLGAEPDPLRQILITGKGRKPKYSWLSIVQCQRSYVLHLKSTWMAEHPVKGHTAPCAEGELLGRTAAHRQLLARLDVSGLLAVPFEMQLASLRRDNNPEMRRQATRAIRLGQAPMLWLGKTMGISNAHANFWTDGTRPAAILLRNDGKEPRTFMLRVGSGHGREFPAGFFVQSDEGAREHVFSGPGSIAVDLGEIAPESERLFLVWSDRAWAGTPGGRQLGVRLLLSGTWLRELLRDSAPTEWHEAARTILDRRVPAARLGDGCLAAGVHGDLWTRGSDPAGLAVRNEGSEPLARSLVVKSGKEHEFPLRVQLHDGSGSREYVFDQPGRMEVDLPEVPARSERLFIIRSERGWTSDSGARRELGVRISIGC